MTTVPLADRKASPPPPPITWRSVSLGLMGVVTICGLTPYNDYALNNTFMVGNNLPLGVVMLLFIMTTCINGPLSRWARSLPLTTRNNPKRFVDTLPRATSSAHPPKRSWIPRENTLTPGLSY